MKKTFPILPALVLLLAGACSKNSGGGGVKLRNDTDSVAYVIGMNVGANLLKMDSTINVNAVCEGIRDMFRGNPRLSAADAETFYLSYVNYALPEKARAYEEQFLLDIAKSNRSYARTSSGVTYTVTDVGDQNQVPTSERDSVALRWVIRTAAGDEITSSYERGDTVRSLVRNLRRGVQESVKLIGKGGKINAWMPSSAAYGAEGDKELGVAPNATLYFEIELVDLPGIYSITPSSSSGEDERVARDYILTGEAEAIINIVDASNLERNLYLTAQLVEMRVPMIVVVNMLDIAKQHKLTVKLDELSRELGCPVVGVVANRESGVTEMKDALIDFLATPSVPPMRVEFDEKIAGVQKEVAGLLSKQGVEHAPWFAGQLLEKAPGIEEKLPGIDLDEARAAVERLDAEYDGDLDIMVANARYDFVAKVADKALVREGEMTATMTDKIDRIVLNRWLGLPIFLLIMYVMFLFTQNLGAAFIDFFDVLVGGVMVDGFGQLLESMGAPEWLKVFLADGIGGGLQTISTFIPVVFFLFLFLAFLEDSGYMARAAFVMDRLMRALGLPGKAFVPLLVGFGCGVPAIMATRTVSSDRDRKMTIMTTTFIPCGAKLPIIALLAGLRPLRDGLLAHQRSEPRLRALLHRHSCRDPHGLPPEAHGASGRGFRLRDGNPALPHPDLQGRDASHLGPRQDLHVPRRPRDRHDRRLHRVLQFARHRRIVRQ